MFFEDYTFTFKDSFDFTPFEMSHHVDDVKGSAPCGSRVVRGDKDAPISKEKEVRLAKANSPPLDLEPRPIGDNGIEIVDALPLTNFIFDDDANFLQEWTELLRESEQSDPGIKDPKLPAAPLVSRVATPPSFDPHTLSNVNDRQVSVSRRDDDFSHYPSMQAANCASAYHSAQSNASLEGDKDTPQIHQHQDEKWSERYEQLKDFFRVHGHSVVPYHYKDFPPLAWWVKRQRHQMRLKLSGSHHTMTEEREQLLNALDFVWDTRAAIWEQRYQELAFFKMNHGHLNISNDDNKSKLLVWVRAQRRQFKLFCAGTKSSLNADRIQKLNSIGFEWDPFRNRS